MFKKIAVAFAFSPTLEALLSEAARVKELFSSELYLVHVGEKKEEEVVYLQELMNRLGLNRSDTHIRWEKGDPPDKILSFCRREKVDLLIAGALKKENLYRYYIGSIARRIIRKSTCSVLILVEPSVAPNPYKEIVIDGSERSGSLKVLEAGCRVAQLQNSQRVHILKEIKLYGFTMAMAAEDSEDEYSEKKKSLVQTEIKYIESQLEKINVTGLKINIKIISGKPGHEINKFARRIKPDLIVLGGPEHQLGFFDRLLPHDLEYILDDIPTNLLIVH